MNQGNRWARYVIRPNVEMLLSLYFISITSLCPCIQQNINGQYVTLRCVNCSLLGGLIQHCCVKFYIDTAESIARKHERIPFFL
jgi:hypothetical protein